MKIIQKLKNIHTTKDCCHDENICLSKKNKKIILVGAPNVGKSALFNALTDSYVTVSNYPGTTVGISKAVTRIEGQNYEVVDTPGMYSLLSISEEEKITRKIIFSGEGDIIIHVIDAKNIERMLPLTLQLIEARLPVILVLNLMDELDKYQMKINVQELEDKLMIPVLPTVATKEIGIDKLKKTIRKYKNAYPNYVHIVYNQYVEQKIKEINELLSQTKQKLSRAITLLLLQDEVSEIDFIALSNELILKINNIKTNVNERAFYSFLYEISLAKQKKTTEITSLILSQKKSKIKSFADMLNELMINPWSGTFILIIVIYVGLYLIVGKFGAGIAVDFVENIIFKKYINPFFIHYIPRIIPWIIVQNLFIGEYGILTLGLRYAIAIILPIIGIFFFVFAIIEDSGYLPRLSMLIDRIFKKIGLSGKAVIPMVLGLGCSTMATMVTRTLPTKRERILATILLACAIPCSAQLGVLFILLAQYPKSLMIWGLFITSIFLLVGYLGAKLLPGNPPIFFMEVPPLRLPTLPNILIKTYARIVWYLKEVFPLFIFASILLWFGQMTGLFNILITKLGYLMKLLGLPEKTAVAFVFGFFRRDFGAAGLYDMQKAGIFTVNQLTVAVITMTLFPACIAQALMMVKERGNKMGTAIFIFCVVTAFSIGFVANIIFTFFNIRL